MNHNVFGADTAKSIFHIYSINSEGKVIKKNLKRCEFLQFFANHVASTIGMEACGGSHHWARELGKLGHEVVLLDAHFVKGFLVGNKNDYNDAQAIYEAVLRPNKRTAQVKTIEQQDMQMLHNVRKSLVASRTSLVNQIRGELTERGIVIKKGINNARKEIPFILEDAENGLTPVSRQIFLDKHEELKILDQKIKAHDQRLGQLCQANSLSKRFLEVPGIGPVIATIVAADLANNGKDYASSRDYAASLGVVPRQHSTGGKQNYLGISKRGNSYIRCLLIHGARSVLRLSAVKKDKLNLWLQQLIARRGFNKAAVALANKNARILWSMAKNDKEYTPAAV
jgi:transposase